MNAPSPIKVVAAQAFERRMPFRFPFRFGAARVTAAPQLFLRLEMVDRRGQHFVGQAAEMMMPKWFDKSPDLTVEDNIDQLRRSVSLAIDAMIAAEAALPFDLHARIENDHHRACRALGLPDLVASYGLAVVDRAIIDGFCRNHEMTVTNAVVTNALGITATTTPDLADFDLNSFFKTLKPVSRIDVRHTVGLGDILCRDDDDERHEDADDGLPRTLEDIIATYGHRYFKLKISGDVSVDITRLKEIAALLDEKVGDYRVTLDGNEQFGDINHLGDFVSAFKGDPALARLWQATLFIEQPVARAEAFNRPLGQIATSMPFEIDESDGTADAFVTARKLGYRGISSKSCKGFYRALLNRARVSKWNTEMPEAGFFMSAEDLTTQSGLCLQQDLALAALIGMTHVERNGHHYVRGMAGAPRAEQDNYLSRHGDLYRHDANGAAFLDIRNGAIELGSVLSEHALGTSLRPDWTAMSGMKQV